MSENRIPLTIYLPEIKIDSIDETEIFDISSPQYADVVSFESILESGQYNTKISLLRDSRYVDIIRDRMNNSYIGVLTLSLYDDTHTLIIVDTNREITFDEKEK